MKYAIFKDVVTVQGHGAFLLLQVGSTVLCVGNSGDKDSGARLEIRLFAPMAKKRFTVKWRGLTKRAADVAVCDCKLDEWITEVINGVCSRCKLPRR